MSLEDAIVKLANSISELAGQYKSLHQNTQALTQTVAPQAPAAFASAPVEAEVIPPVKKGRGRPKLEAVPPAPAPAPKSKPKVEDPLADPFAEAPAPAPAPKAKAAAAQTSGTTKDEVLDALRQAVRVKGEDPVLALLQEFGGSKVSEIAAEDYAGLLARLEGMIDG